MQNNHPSFELKKIYDFGSVVLSEKDIIDFAIAYDPLDFHLSKEAAAQSVFGTLVASGPHLFNWFYKNRWVPVFKETVLAGLELNQWKLLHPVHPNKNYFCSAEISSIKRNTHKKHQTVLWKFFIKDETRLMVQSLEMTVLHKTV